MGWPDGRVPILYLAPWVDIGGADKGTIDWFRFLDRDRFRASLMTTQPSANRRLHEVVPYADEVWELPELMDGDEMARFIVTFVVTRGISVVHAMNSRLGFDLLPDIAGLPDPPCVVVQLHVEESDRSGYVRYVTTRYGSLVDAFSVSSQALSDALGAYEVPSAKRRVIRTGVDAEREFSPLRVKPIELDRDRFQILFPARVTAQKDPLLMVDVAAELRKLGLAFQIHVLGDGDLIAAVRQRVAAAGLGDAVVLHGDVTAIAPWYAACDAVLLTSEFEGVPYVAYEAMAMATPIVAPALPGLGELITADTGALVSPQSEAGAYAAAIRGLAGDPQLRHRIGAAARSRARREFSLERMARGHRVLYEELLARRQAADRRSAPPANGKPPVQLGVAAFRGRRPGATPLVSVIVPCFNHGAYLGACLGSIAEQSYEPIETIVVDDGSTDPETIDALAALERSGTATVVRLPGNRGPSAARNVALERCRGRYVLPLDADNMLLPGAVAGLVEQLGKAGEQVGFVYPNVQFFGNRTDYLEPPSYNLDALLMGNHCDTASLFDREIFDRGFRYAEDIVLGHEDWDLVLSLAEHGIHGEAARMSTLLCRKHAFTRSDLVEAANVPFAEVVASRHPRLFDPGPRALLKGEWNPAVTLIGLDPLSPGSDDALTNLIAGAAGQTCADFEVIVQTGEEFWPSVLGRRLRRLPSALTGSRAQALAEGLPIARGRYALASYGSLGRLLADRTLIEKTLRILTLTPQIDAIAFAQSDPGLRPFQLLDGGTARRAKLDALCWETIGPAAPPSSLALRGDDPLSSLAGGLPARAAMQWRHLARRDRRAIDAPRGGPGAMIGSPRLDRARDDRTRIVAPALPDCPPGVASRLRRPSSWTPPQARSLWRHFNRDSGRYAFTNEGTPPPGYAPGYQLGCVRAWPLAGTRSLLIGAGDGDPFVLGGDAELDAPALLGFVEQVPLPLFDVLQVGRHRDTGEYVLIAGGEDPLAGSVDVVRNLGYIEPYPIHPRHPPHLETYYGLVGLVRTVDPAVRRHRYGAGQVPAGLLAGELGALLAEPDDDCEPLWIDADGRVFATDLARAVRPPVGVAIRWVGAPLTWRNFGALAPKLRSCARRGYDALRIVAVGQKTPPSRPPEPAGYILHSASSRTIPLYGAIHPVTGDQLLSTRAEEPHDLGYGNVVRLGFLIAGAPVTGALGVRHHGVPWAYRFGLLGETR